jgi:DNA-binding transcriptional MerR regulator
MTRSLKKKRYDILAKEGYRSYRPAALARAEIKRLRDSGMSVRDIVSASGLGHYTIERIRTGRREQVQAATLRILRNTRPAPSRVPIIGAQRRVRALCRLGWTIPMQEAFSGVQVSSALYDRRVTVTQEVREAIERMYHELGRKEGPSRSSRLRAEAKGWPGPAAWDEDTIDDPDAIPYSGRYEPPARGKGWVEEYHFLLSCGESHEQALKRVGITQLSFEKRMARENKARRENAA